MTHTTKRYRVKTEKELLLEGWVEDGWFLKHPQAAVSTPRYGLGGEIEGRPTGYARVTDGTTFWHEDMLVELSDDDHLMDAASYIGVKPWGGTVRVDPGLWGDMIAAPPRQRCTDHTWVNYTPYHDASPMAKFACKSCNRERD